MGIYTSDYLNTSRVMGNYWSTSRASLKNQYIRIWTPRPTEARRRNCQLHKWRFGFNLILPKPPPPNTHPHQPARPRADSAGAKLRTLLRDWEWPGNPNVGAAFKMSTETAGFGRRGNQPRLGGRRKCRLIGGFRPRGKRGARRQAGGMSTETADCA